ncbi:MAG TPA: hypothetical protein VKZ86_04240 [Cyclobacteriaceae bacterium]|nr:hypothetical protein [Cyclobacteriaceae bacterium]
MHVAKGLYRIPLMFFALAACFGLLLRWHVVHPLDWVHYPYMLHAHSHLMFLGWVTNALVIFGIEAYVADTKARWYRRVFYWLQALLVGMAVSFPLQGYGVASIVLSTLHTGLIVVLSIRFFRDTKSSASTASLWYMRIALVYFLVSAVGPIAIGGTSATGLGQTKWYYLSVYYYLHFQYNGFFTFGGIAVLLHLLEKRGILFNIVEARRAGRYLAIACVPAYLLSTLWTDPGIVFNAIGFFAAVLQIISLWLLVKCLRPATREIASKADRLTIYLLVIGLISYGIKLFAQWLSAFPSVAHLAFANRPYVMAYLHLVLIGTITLPLLVWYHERLLFGRLGRTAVAVFVVGFLSTEVILMLMPSAPYLGPGLGGTMGMAILVASVILVAGVILLLASTRKT